MQHSRTRGGEGKAKDFRWQVVDEIYSESGIENQYTKGQVSVARMVFVIM